LETVGASSHSSFDTIASTGKIQSSEGVDSNGLSKSTKIMQLFRMERQESYLQKVKPHPLSPSSRGHPVLRYASLFFIACVDNTDNELITLEKIHLFVEILDRYFGNVIASLFPPLILPSIHKLSPHCSGLRIGYHLQLPQSVLYSG
jgi:hypothetical protein